jgi:MerR family transcriptional regulator, redox-sensitive transcriptional activator SoxR
MEQLLTIGEVARRTGIATSAVRFYESRGLIGATRTEAGQRRFRRDVLRRISFIRVAQRVGLGLEEIEEALSELPPDRAPSRSDWERLSRHWREQFEERIRILEGLRDGLTECIGCGCLSLRTCRLCNPDDHAADFGTGPRYLLGNSSDEVLAGKA